MSTNIKIHAVGATISHEDLECFRDWSSRSKCKAPRRPGSMYDSEPIVRIVASRDDGIDPRPCGHWAAIEEGDSISIGWDDEGYAKFAGRLFPWRYQTVILTKELVHEIVKVAHLNGKSEKNYGDRKIINWLTKHIGDEVFCVNW